MPGATRRPAFDSVTQTGGANSIVAGAISAEPTRDPVHDCEDLVHRVPAHLIHRLNTTLAFTPPKPNPLEIA
jgi:hypothetical protein